MNCEGTQEEELDLTVRYKKITTQYYKLRGEQMEEMEL